jgi:hypothetical protein
MRRCLVMAVALLACGLALGQDKDSKKDSKKEEPTVVAVRASLPKGWKALGLTDKQKTEVLNARAKYAAKRRALEEQIKALKAEEMTALEKLLTDAQKQRLKELEKK